MTDEQGKSTTVATQAIEDMLTCISGGIKFRCSGRGKFSIYGHSFSHGGGINLDSEEARTLQEWEGCCKEIRKKFTEFGIVGRAYSGKNNECGRITFYFNVEIDMDATDPADLRRMYDSVKEQIKPREDSRPSSLADETRWGVEKNITVDPDGQAVHKERATELVAASIKALNELARDLGIENALKTKISPRGGMFRGKADSEY